MSRPGFGASGPQEPDDSDESALSESEERLINNFFASLHHEPAPGWEQRLREALEVAPSATLRVGEPQGTDVVTVLSHRTESPLRSRRLQPLAAIAAGFLLIAGMVAFGVLVDDGDSPDTVTGPDPEIIGAQEEVSLPRVVVGDTSPFVVWDTPTWLLVQFTSDDDCEPSRSPVITAVDDAGARQRVEYVNAKFGHRCVAGTYQIPVGYEHAPLGPETSYEIRIALEAPSSLVIDGERVGSTSSFNFSTKTANSDPASFGPPDFQGYCELIGAKTWVHYEERIPDPLDSRWGTRWCLYFDDAEPGVLSDGTRAVSAPVGMNEACVFSFGATSFAVVEDVDPLSGFAEPAPPCLKHERVEQTGESEAAVVADPPEIGLLPSSESDGEASASAEPRIVALSATGGRVTTYAPCGEGTHTLRTASGEQLATLSQTLEDSGPRLCEFGVNLHSGFLAGPLTPGSSYTYELAVTTSLGEDAYAASLAFDTPDFEEPCPSMQSGTWTGTWAAELFELVGPFSATFDFEGTNIGGEIDLQGSPISLGGKVTGTIDCHVVNLTIDGGSIEVTGTVAPSGTEFTGDFELVGIDRGTLTALRLGD